MAQPLYLVDSSVLLRWVKRDWGTCAAAMDYLFFARRDFILGA